MRRQYPEVVAAWERDEFSATQRHQARKRLDPFWDIGHPLNLKRAPFTRLFREYDTIHYKTRTLPGHMQAQELYFIGRRKTASDGGPNDGQDGGGVGWYI